jgi:hypothetical protein
MKAGQTVKLIGIPPNLSNEEDMPTRTLFEKCLGKYFVVEAVESVEGVPFPLARLDVGHVIGEESWQHTIWVEPEYLQPSDGYRVYVVLDREYGDRLSKLAADGPVWIVDTPTNRAVAQKIWTADPNRSHLDGVTTFKTADASSPETALIEQLDTIDLHHGTYSANPPYTVLEIIGATISERIQTELSQFGFDQFQGTAEGFCAVRQLPETDILIPSD